MTKSISELLWIKNYILNQKIGYKHLGIGNLLGNKWYVQFGYFGAYNKGGFKDDHILYETVDK